jgi:hypothetical protein
VAKDELVGERKNVSEPPPLFPSSSASFSIITMLNGPESESSSGGLEKLK